MSFSDLIARMKRFDKNAEVIFDREEPIGMTTDLVMPRRRWFRRAKSGSPVNFNSESPTRKTRHDTRRDTADTTEHCCHPALPMK